MNPKDEANRLKKKKKNFREKFVPTFKKKIPTWKQIDIEAKKLVAQYDDIVASKINTFSDFPLSKRTMDGLNKSNYSIPTEIQRESIGIALRGYDLLGAAKTGSGKTLAFLIPVLECLYHSKWTKHDGLGVLIISPTRELAYQTFEVLKRIGKYHDFSAGLVIGGKDLKTESKIINQTNIIVCTPGRLLQHMDETWNFSCDSLKILVLDEADRILDMGFSETMNAIIENLPSTRQTILFSATQTKSVKDLARLSLKNPTYVSVHEHSNESTPSNLVQNYVVCDTHDKVKYIYELFNRMSTGMTTLALYGTMNQIRRMEVYDQYCRKLNAILFATDIAARGLDFPSINWVIQMDCPPDANTYIHRVGRTARYEKDGQAILVLTPSEETAMLDELKIKRIPISKIEPNMKRIMNMDSKIQSLCAGDVELKESAKRALMAYMRSIYLMSNKKLFNLESIDIVKFSQSLGLVIAPRIRFAQKSQQQIQKNKQTEENNNSTNEDEVDDKKEKKAKNKRHLLQLKQIAKEKEAKENSKYNPFSNNADEDEDDSLFTVKRVFDSKDNAANEEFDLKNKIKLKSKASVVKQIKKKKFQVNEKIQFDDEGNRILTNINQPRSINITDALAEEVNKKDSKKEVGGIDIEEAKRLLRNEDQFDKQLYRERIKRVHREKRLKEKDLRRAKRAKTENNEDEFVANVTLNTEDDNNHDNDYNEKLLSDDE